MPHTGPVEDFEWKMAEIRMSRRRCTVYMATPQDADEYGACNRLVRVMPIGVVCKDGGPNKGSVSIHCKRHGEVGYWNSAPIPPRLSGS